MPAPPPPSPSPHTDQITFTTAMDGGGGGDDLEAGGPPRPDDEDVDTRRVNALGTESMLAPPPPSQSPHTDHATITNSMNGVGGDDLEAGGLQRPDDEDVEARTVNAFRSWIGTKWVDVGLRDNPAWLRPTAFAMVVMLSSIASGWVSGFPAPTEEAIIHDLNMDTTTFALFASLATLGTLFAAPFAIGSAHLIGRKLTISLGMLLCMIGWIWIYFSKTKLMICWARTLTGVGAGFLVYPAPTYMMEISPDLGPTLVGINQVVFTIGMLLAYGIGIVSTWRILALIGITPSVLFMILAVFIPDSDDVELLRAKSRRVGNGPARQIRRRDLFVGVGILALQQLCGINGLLFYSSRIFKSIGVKFKELTIVIGFVQLVFTIIGVALINEERERGMLLISNVGMCISLLIASVAIFCEKYLHASKWVVVGGLAVRINLHALKWVVVGGLAFFVAFFSFGMSFVPWIVAVKRFPEKWSIIGPALAASLRSGISFIVTMVFKSAFEWSRGGTFLIFAVICGVSAIFVGIFVKQQVAAN